MKNLFIGLGVLAMVAGTSCKKEYTCECTVTGGGSTASSSTTIKATKKDAKESCETGSSTVGTGDDAIVSKCEIK